MSSISVINALTASNTLWKHGVFRVTQLRGWPSSECFTRTLKLIYLYLKQVFTLLFF